MTITSPTDEQQAIFAHLRDTALPLIVDAKAGSGKTTTIVEALPLLRGTSSLQAFNRAIADELKQRVGTLGFAVAAAVQVSTVHSHGLASFRKSGAKPTTQSGKLHFMLKDMLEGLGPDNPIYHNSRHISKLVSYAKSAGFGLTSCQPELERFPVIEVDDHWNTLISHFQLDEEFEGTFSIDTCIGYARRLLVASNARPNMIDFDDMIYLPLLHNLPITRYENVILDEAQDINATRRELAFRSLQPSGRIIAVGDPNQAIYGFTGASVDSLDRIRDRAPNSITLPLSICWRCDEEIITHAQELVPTIKARPGAGPGEVTSIAFRDESSGHDFLALPTPGEAILCRLNKPNVAVCLGLLRRGVPAKIEGRDLGRKLLDHVKKSTELYAFQPLADTLHDLASYREREVQKLITKQRESSIPLLEDEVDAAELIMERCIEMGTFANTQVQAPNFVALEAMINTLFGDDVDRKRTVTLSSIHKAKGREWPTVYILGRYDYMPFFKATSPWELEQEDNLIYVAYTRAEKRLVFVTGVAAALDKGLHREAALTFKDELMLNRLEQGTE